MKPVIDGRSRIVGFDSTGASPCQDLSQIIDHCEQRLKFVRDKLDYRSTHDAGVKQLRLEHEKYLPEALREEISTPT